MTKYKMKNLLVEIKQWMATNVMLKLNDSETEIMAVDGPRPPVLQWNYNFSLLVARNLISPSVFAFWV